MTSVNTLGPLWHGRLAHVLSHGRDVRASRRNRSGATLLVTLGILSVLSVMVVTFLLSARHQSLSAKHFRDKTVARQALDVALTRAMEYADKAMIASNYNEIASTGSALERKSRRVAPLGRWYSRAYEIAADLPSSPAVNYQTQDILLVPVTNKTATSHQDVQAVDLLTDEVRHMLPPALTNRLSCTLDHPYRSGWITDPDGHIRVSFAVLNTSGFIDAHRYDFENKTLRGATQHIDRVFFSRQDLANADSDTGTSDPDELNAFGVFSYDPGRDATPLDSKNNGVSSALGYREFAISNKFNIASVTNFLVNGRVRATRQFEDQWLRPVSNALAAADQPSASHPDVTLGSVQKVAWNIANYMSPSRVPVVSYPGVTLASREDYGIEDVPLINEVQVFTCTDRNGNTVDGRFNDAVNTLVSDVQNRFINFGSTDKEWEPIVPSNLYATAVEVWYPFVPHPVPENTRVYIGVYTNSGGVSTTTNSAWSSSDLADYYGLDDPTMAELLVNILNTQLENTPDTFTNSAFWASAQTDDALVSVIENPSTFNETNLLTLATGIATAMVWVYTDPDTGLIDTNNPYTELVYEYTPADTNIYTTADAVSNYYATASNYVPAVTILLTNRVDDVLRGDGGTFIDNTQTIIQQYLPASKVEVADFPKDYYQVGEGDDFQFNEHGFCVVTNSKTLISFPAFEETETTRRIVFHRLGANAAFHTWVRPLVAIRENNGDGVAKNDGYEAVDEALLTENKDTGVISVMEWKEEDSYSVADPRANAWAGDNLAAASWYSVRNTFGYTNEVSASSSVPGASEIPFIHMDTPFHSIGELGNIAIDLNAKEHNKSYRPDIPERDTIDFATRAGAATLDRFTIASSNAPLYGLIQANTTYADAVRQILNDTPMGWTNGFTQFESADEHAFSLNSSDTHPELEKLTEVWTNALFKTSIWDTDKNGLPGWSSFADMLPDLSTNVLVHSDLDFASMKGDDTYYRHDYIEDVMRGIVDKVSFRQNVYVVIIAAQALSPASTDTSPIILSDQRAAVTVLRDAYTGRWMIYNWVWLSE